VTTLDFSPRPGAASMRRAVTAHAAMETRLLVRNGEQVLLAIVIPLLLLIGGAEAGGLINLGHGRRIDILTPGILALAVLSTAFTSLAIATGFERRYGVLKRLGSSPLSTIGLLLGKTVSLLVVEALQLAVISGTALILGWRPSGGAAAALQCGALVVLGTAAFAGLALLMAGTLRAEATLAAANLVYVVLLAAGGVVVPLAKYPHLLQPVVAGLPSGALADGLRAATRGNAVGWQPLLVLTVWAAVAATAATRTFRWE
jgi:ABC-2 type transport system permease protein